ncbi:MULTISPECIES: DUF2730 family protein [unclassified Ensifer]|uniref:DUF2730 family protein n=1 Tax=unclassified Ensifer TaxID=2633371 RepID=UPI0008133980|nr:MULTISPECIES: DUF2730 family protein [unclassified Ensifer]OCP17450.1 hypothetical protein BC361_08310 [Ensifer sp. LC54]OCP28644.1 hypothetical protein BC363_02045 [Ensifer sp. LC384]
MVETLKSWLGLLSLIISVGIALWTIISSGSKQTANELAEFKKTDASEKKALMEAVQALGQRTQTLESELKHLPDRETTHRMELAMMEINGKLNVMAERLKPIEAIGERLQEALLEKART